MKRAVFISAGIGDSLLTLPLARRLRETSQNLVAILTSTAMTASFLEKLNLFDHIEILPLKHHRALPDWNFVRCALRHFRAFDEVYLPPFALSRYNRVISFFLGKRRFECLPRKNDPFPMVHDAVQNLRLLDPQISPTLRTDQMSFPSQTIQRLVQGQALPVVDLPYVAVQLSAVEGPFAFKRWPIENWEAWLQMVTQHFPTRNWVLVGGPREQAAIAQIMAKGFLRVHAALTSRSLECAAATLHAADLFVGLDGGLMHLAASLNRPTFTLWGGSNPQLVGYEQMDIRRHRIVSLKTACGPCDSWLNPNQTRVKVARECPDFMCMRSLSPTEVFQQFVRFVEQLR